METIVSIKVESNLQPRVIKQRCTMLVDIHLGVSIYIFFCYVIKAPFVSTENVFRKTFSAFADVCFDVK